MKKIKWLAAGLAVVMLLLTACGVENTYTGATESPMLGFLPETVITSEPEQEEQIYGTTVPTTMPTVKPTQKPEQEDHTENDAQMVWIPMTGKKYHSKANCSGMKDPSKITITEAQNRGYTPCKKCW